MEIGKDSKGRWWGVEPYVPHRHTVPQQRRYYNDRVEALKGAGFGVTYNLTLDGAKKLATHFEKVTGIEMLVFNHDRM